MRIPTPALAAQYPPLRRSREREASLERGGGWGFGSSRVPSRQEVGEEAEYGGRTSRSQDRRTQPRAARCIDNYILMLSACLVQIGK